MLVLFATLLTLDIEDETLTTLLEEMLDSSEETADDLLSLPPAVLDDELAVPPPEQAVTNKAATNMHTIWAIGRNPEVIIKYLSA